MTIRIAELYRYPVKGLSADALDSVAVRADRCFPCDRRWAIAHAASKLDSASPRWADKQNFLMLARDGVLARLVARFDDDTRVLEISRKGRVLSRGRLDDITGRMVLQSFLSGFLPQGPRGNPKIVEAPGGEQFTDVPEPLISLINLASVRDIERVARRPINPLRFRGNILIEGAAPWAEQQWPGTEISIAGITFHCESLIARCAATNIDPDSAAEDINMPLTLRQGFGHIHCGVYLRARGDGTLTRGDTLQPD